MFINQCDLNLRDRVLSIPLETLLVSGGDKRMLLLEQGLNKYGCAPWVRGAIAFGNCTASSLSPHGLSGARMAYDRLRAAACTRGDDGVLEESEQMLSEYRQRLTTLFRLEDRAHEVVFCPSGTDAEMVALSLARGGGSDAIVNVVVAPSEVGGGTLPASAGRHFNEQVPTGEARKVGAPIDEVLSEAVRVSTITVRDERGLVRSAAELDEHADEVVTSAIESGAQVLLHVVTHSKTGVYAPSFDKAAELRERFGNRVKIVLDAAQGRLSRRSIGLALGHGYMVLMTGSKFYGGPPFSGVLLVPPQFSPEQTGSGQFSVGMRDYLTAPELPASWTGLRDSLPEKPNIGLILRWAAALAQMEAYYDVDYDTRRAVMRFWEETVPQVLDDSENVTVVPVEPIRGAESSRYLEATTTVFPFYVDRVADVPLRPGELRWMFDALNRDMSGELPAIDVTEKSLLAAVLHVGQPVLLSGEAEEERAVLRVALGGPMVVAVATDLRIGRDFKTRLQWLRAQLEILRGKVEVLVKYQVELEAMR